MFFFDIFVEGFNWWKYKAYSPMYCFSRRKVSLAEARGSCVSFFLFRDLMDVSLVHYRYYADTSSTLRFGQQARAIQNKASVNEITEDDVSNLSDQIRQLKVRLSFIA